jgi:hypothetical protein
VKLNFDDAADRRLDQRRECDRVNHIDRIPRTAQGPHLSRALEGSGVILRIRRKEACDARSDVERARIEMDHEAARDRPPGTDAAVIHG